MRLTIEHKNKSAAVLLGTKSCHKPNQQIVNECNVYKYVLKSIENCIKVYVLQTIHHWIISG